MPHTEEEAAVVSSESVSSSEITTTTTDDDEDFQVLKQRTKYITLEPAAFFFVIGYGVNAVTTQSFIVDILTTTMAPGLNCSSFMCQNITVDKRQHEEIQSVAAKYFIGRSLFEISFQILYAAFLEGWINKQGCKLTIVCPMFGAIFSSLSLILLSFSDAIAHPILVIFTSLPLGLLGGSMAIMTSANIYMSKVTEVESRSLRLAIVESALFIAYPSGVLLGAEVLKYSNFSITFLVGLGLYCFAAICSIFIPNDKKKMLPILKTLREIFNLDNVRDTSKLFNYLRFGTKPSWIVFLLIICALRKILLGCSDTWILYTNLKLDWTSLQYSNFVTADGLLQFIGVGLLVSGGIKFFKFRDTTLGIVGALGYTISCFIWAFPIHSWSMYLGSIVGLLSGSGSVLARSCISKLIDPTHFGKIFVLIGIIEISTQLCGSFLFGFIYSETVTLAPNSTFFVAAVFSSIMLALFVYLRIVLPDEYKRNEERLIVTEDEQSVQA